MKNGKVILVFTLLAAFILPLSDLSADESSIRVNSSTLAGLSFVYAPETAKEDTISVKDKNYVRYTYDSHSYRNTPGYPSIPSKTVYLVAGKDTPSVVLNNLSTRVVTGKRIVPVPKLVNAENGFTGEVYVEDTKSYALSGYKPDLFYSIEKSGDAGNMAIWKMTLFPLQYDAHSSTVSFADSFTVNVSFANFAPTSSDYNYVPYYAINRDLLKENKVFKSYKTLTSPFASGDWYRINLNTNGIYKLTKTELDNAGLSASSINSNQIRIYYGGGKLIDQVPHSVTMDNFKEIPIKIVDGGDGIFNSGDYILFYGESLSRFIIESDSDKPVYQNHLFSDKNCYWLTISNVGEPLRISSESTGIDTALSPTNTYHCYKHMEQENYLELMDSNLQAGVEWYWDTISSTAKSFVFTAPGVAGSPATIYISFLNQQDGTFFYVNTYLNSQLSKDYYIDVIGKKTISYVYNSTLIESGNNLNIYRKFSNSDDISHLDWIEVDYLRKLDYTGSNFEFFNYGNGSPVKFVVSGNMNSLTEIYDTTDPYSVKEISDKSYSSSSATLTFQVNTVSQNFSKYTITNKGSYLSVSSIAKKSSSNLWTLSNQPNYIVITNSLFLDEANRLAEWRATDSSSETLVPYVVTVSDIYDEFNWGVTDPIAIRDFLKHLYENGDRTKNYYCCMFGDATYKYKNVSSTSTQNLVPTYTDFFEDESLTTDDFFGWFSFNTHIPSFAFGRICVSDKPTASYMVDKIINYEKNPVQGDWHNNVLLVADDEYGNPPNVQEIVHSNDIETLDTGNYIPKSLHRTKIMMIEYPFENKEKPTATEAVLKAFNDGSCFSVFIGHGNNTLLAHEHLIIGTRDIGSFNNGGKQSVFFIASCMTNNFILPDNVSLAEMLHNKNNGGCIGVVAATSETYSYGNSELLQKFFTIFFNKTENPDYRLGLALLKAKANIDEQNASKYVLLGDPAMKVMCPKYKISTASIDTIYRLEKLNLDAKIKDSNNNSINYNGKFYFKAYGPKQNLIYYTTNNTYKIKYTKPGNIFYKGEYDISADSIDVSLIIPKDLSSNTKESMMSFFASGQNDEASGYLDGYYIGGLDNNAAADVTGPEINISFDGQSFSDGDYIGRTPTLSASITDDSGINLVGTRGHNISLVIDKTDSYVLTDSYTSLNSFTSGKLEYALPTLSSGEHLLELSVYDTYNNISKKSFKPFVVGSENGNINIRNLLNYPNPASSDGTTFTFELTDDAKNAQIKIYSQAGRLVESFKLSAHYGYNQVYWKPIKDLANGVYFYKLSVSSLNGRKDSKIEKLVIMK